MTGMESLFLVSVFSPYTGEKFLFSGVGKIIPDIECKVNISFDQSSTQTGIVIMGDDKRLLLVIDLINGGLPDSDSFIRLFRKWLNNNFMNLDIHYLICERAEQNARQMYSKKVLQKLIGVLEDFAFDKNITCYQLDNKVWKKHYLKDEKFKGRRLKTELVKPAVVERSIDLYPVLRTYYNTMKGTDSADALGIMHGFLEEVFVNGFNSNKKVCSIMPTAPKRKYSLQFVTIEEFKQMVKENVSAYRGFEPVYYNPDYTLEDNARRIINFYPNGTVVVTNDSKVIALWQFTADKELNLSYCMVVRHL